MNVPTVMRQDFSKVPQIGVQRSTFDRSHGVTTAFDAGYLIPVLVDEVVPGDTFNCRMTAFARLATPLKPVMDNMYLDTFFFFVPSRLVWTHHVNFWGERVDPADDPTVYVIPTIPLPDDGPEIGSLADYFGLPTDNSFGPISVNALPFRAAALIWNEWFRDENLQDSTVVDTDDGPDTYSDYSLMRRCKRPDYFTKCLPWAQKADAVSLPIGASTAPVTRVSNSDNWLAYNEGGNTLAAAGDIRVGAAGVIENTIANISFDPNGGLIADLSSALATTINELRDAVALQELYERDARGGTRYVETLRSQYGVTAPSGMINRSEYLGGGSSPINIHPVPMTAMASGGTPAGQQGNLAAFGTASVQGHGFNKGFVEHGYVIGFVNVRADIRYQQGIDRMWTRSIREDFYIPALANLGEQAVLNKEIYAYLADGTAANQKDGVFGYQERYGDYRTKKSMITGAMRSQAPTLGLDVWHLAEEHTAQPVLGDTFIQDNPPIDRVIAVTTEPHFLFDGYFKYICARPMPVYGIPSLGSRL